MDFKHKLSCYFRERILNTSSQEANIMHLKPNTEYQFWVAAYNRYGVSIVPAQLKIKTKEEGW